MTTRQGSTIYQFAPMPESSEPPSELLRLDAFEAWKHSPSAYVVAKTDSAANDGASDQNWRLIFSWDGDNVGTVAILDAGTTNTDGPKVLQWQVTGETRQGAVCGIEPSAEDFWTLSSGGLVPGEDYALMLYLHLGGYTLTYPLPPTNQMDTVGTPMPAPPDPVVGFPWLLGLTTPASAWLNTKVEDQGNEYIVWDMLVDMWNSIPGTDWHASFAPYLLWWLWEYPLAFPDPSQWPQDAKRFIYTPLYYVYFASVPNPPKEGWGVGNPPTADLPEPR